MALSIISSITKNIRDTLHGASIDYNGEAHAIYADRVRVNPVDLDRYPIVDISNPIEEVQGRSAGRRNSDIYYIISLRDQIDDTPQEGIDIASIEEVMSNVPADLEKILTWDFVNSKVDINKFQRGGYANSTFVEKTGSYIDENGFYVAFIVIKVNALIMDFNPYQKG